MTDETSSSCYPEHDKLLALSDKSQVIGEFLQWLRSEGMEIAYWRTSPNAVEPRLTVLSKSINSLLAKYFDINQDKLDREKADMVRRLRETQKPSQFLYRDIHVVMK